MKKLFFLLFGLLVLVRCTNYIDNDLYVFKGNYNLFNEKNIEELYPFVEHENDSIVCLVRALVVDSTALLKIKKDVELKIYSSEALLFERKKNDFYFENYLAKNTTIFLKIFDGFYYYKISLEKKSQVLVAFSSENPDDVNFISDVSDISKLSRNDFGLPLIKINTPFPITNKEKTESTVTINDKSFQAKIKIRGKTSQSFPKKQFTLEFEAPNKFISNKTDAVLNGTFSDRSLIRNAFAYQLSSKIGLRAPKTSFYNVSINNVYEGIYALMDKPTPSEKFNLIKIDDKVTFGTKNESIKEEGMKQIHYEVLSLNDDYSADKRIIDDMEHLCSTNKIDSIIDVSSFAKYFIINELTKNIDAYRKSIYLTHDLENKKLIAGPVWDYDLSLGLPNFNDGFNPEGFVYDYEPMKPWMAFWWNELMNNPIFKKELVYEYRQLRKKELSNQEILSFVDSLYTLVQKDAELNFKRWDVLETKDFWPNYYTPNFYKNEIEYIKEWLLKRLDWLDKQWLISPPQS
ncbi:MAG: CotH kinase family protein [Bacteroidia bacterium]